MDSLFKHLKLFRTIKNITLIISLLVFISCQQNKKQIEKSDFHPEAVELNKKAMEMARNNYRDDTAMELLDKAINIDPDYYFSHSNKANIYGWRKEFEKAIFESEKALKLNPDLPERWLNTGLCYEKINKKKKALRCFKKSIELFDKKIEDPNFERRINAYKFNRAIAKVFIDDKTYKKDFEELKKIKSYTFIIERLQGKSKAELLDEFL